MANNLPIRTTITKIAMPVLSSNAFTSFVNVRSSNGLFYAVLTDSSTGYSLLVSGSLQRVELGVPAFGAHERSVVAHLDDFTVVEDIDHVGHPHR